MPAETGSYLDFDLSIWAEGNQYFARVIASPAGSTEKVKLRQPFPGQPQADLLLRLENAVLRARGHVRGPRSKEEIVLRDFGRELFNIVFREVPQIANQFVSSLNMVEQRRGEIDGLRLKLRLEPPELGLLPWEYVYDDINREYLCLRHRSPVVRFLDIPQPSAALRVDGPLNILGMIANPGGEWTTLDAENERRRVDDAIAPLQQQGKVNFRWVPGDTSGHLLDMMRQGEWHVFHFIGHGGVYGPSNDPSETADGFVVFGDGQGGPDKVSADQLSLILQGDGSLKLAVLNCCESARGGSGYAFSSPGAALVKSGVPAVVAMQFPISDEAAIQFANGFYKSLIAGYPVEKAVTSARVEIRTRSDVEWGIPVLFTRAGSGALFTIESRRQSPQRVAPANLAPIVATESAQAAARQKLRQLFQR